jgi:hypothetical protein
MSTASKKSAGDQAAEVQRLQRIIDGLAARVAAQAELLARRAERPPARAELWYVLCYRGSGWRVVYWDQSDPVGYYTEAEAQARCRQLQDDYARRHGKDKDGKDKQMYPPPVVQRGLPLRMKPKPKERRHHYTAAELNGEATLSAAMPAGSPRTL